MATINPITGQVDAGINTLPGAQTTVANPAVSNEINQAYQNLFGRAADPEGAQYWAGTGLTGDALTQAMIGGARGADIGTFYKTGDLDISPDITAADIKSYVTQNINDPFAIYSSAQKYNVDPATIAAVTGMNLQDLTSKFGLAGQVAQEYQDIGRGLTGTEAIDPTGFNYWYNQLQSGAITPDQFEKTFLTSALETVGRGGAGEDVAAKTLVESLIKGYGGADLASQINPLEVFEEFRTRGLRPEDIVAKNPNLTTQQISDYFANVPKLYEQDINQTFADVFGSSALGSNAFAKMYTPEQKQAIVNNLLTGKMTREDFEKSLQESGLNKQEEATRIANIYAQAFGGSAEDARALYAKLIGADYKGTGVVDNTVYSKARQAFEQGLKSEKASDEGIASLLRQAANREGAENNPFFQQNPDALTIYRDVGKTKEFTNAGTGGQYGYYKGIPILKASEADEVFDKMGTDYIMGNAPDRLDNDIGWDTGSLAALQARGAAALGVRKQENYDPETGIKTSTSYTGDLEGLAAKLGIDPTKFKDSYRTVRTVDPDTGLESTQRVIDKSAQDKLFEAVDKAAEDFYFIAGKTGRGVVNDRGETPAFTRDDKTGNHASVLYQKVGDKLIPIEQTLKYYNAGEELSPGTWFSDTFGGVASIPGIAELSLLIPGAGPGTYAALKAAQVAALGGEFKDMAKAGAMAYAGAKFLPQLGGEISGGLTNLGVTNPILQQAITQGVIGGGVSALTGGSGADALKAGLITGGISGGLNTLVRPEAMEFAEALGISKENQPLFANTLTQLAPTILTGGKIDPTKLLMSIAMNKAIEEAKTEGKQKLEKSGAKSIMASDSAENSSSGLYPKDVQSWIDEGSTPEARRYRASIATKYGLTEEPISDTEFVPKGYRNSMYATPFDPNAGQYLIEQGDNMMVRPSEMGNAVGLGALRERLGSGDIRI